jgi:hypothetical protein
MDRNRQMDTLLKNNQVTENRYIQFSKKNSSLSMKIQVLFIKRITWTYEKEFNDLRSQRDYLQGSLHINSNHIIDHSIAGLK